MHCVQVPKSGSNNMPIIIKNMLKKSIIINYRLFMQRFNIYKARLYHARGFLGKAQAWLKLTTLDTF